MGLISIIALLYIDFNILSKLFYIYIYIYIYCLYIYNDIMYNYVYIYITYLQSKYLPSTILVPTNCQATLHKRLPLVNSTAPTQVKWAKQCYTMLNRVPTEGTAYPTLKSCQHVVSRYIHMLSHSFFPESHIFPEVSPTCFQYFNQS